MKFQNKKLAEDSGEGYVSAEEEEEDFDSGNITLNGDQNIKNLSPKKSFKKLPADGKVRNCFVKRLEIGKYSIVRLFATGLGSSIIKH